MATGTGLPTGASGGPVVAQAASVASGDSLYNADSWNKIAASGERLKQDGFDYLKVSEHQAQVGYLANQDVQIQRKQIELRDKHAFDPKAYDNEWNAFTEGKLTEAAPWAVGHIKAKLGSTGNAGYSAILNETRAKTESDAKASWNSLEDQASNDVTGTAMAGTLHTPEGQSKISAYRGVIQSGVSSLFIPQAEADRRIANLESQAVVYGSRTNVKTVYDTDGAIAATKNIDEIVRNENLKLSPEQRLALGSRLRADVHAWDAERQQNLSSVDLEANALLEAKKGGIVVPQSRIDDAVERYKKFGGQAQGATFLANIQHADELSFLARVPVSEASAWIQRKTQEAGFSTAVNQTIPAEGRALLDKIAGTESRGRYDVRYDGKAGATITDFKDHPRVAEAITSGPDVGKTSSAAGRYQFIGTTWDDQAKKLNLKDFSPANQDAAAWNLAQEEYKAKTGKDLLAVLRSDDKAAIADVPRQLSGQWSSLPGGRQPASAPSATANETSFLGKANSLVSKRVTEEADGIIANMQKDILPTRQQIDTLLTSASATNNPDVLSKVSVAAAEYQFRRQFGRAPLPEEMGKVSELQQRATTDGLNQSDAKRLEIAKEVSDRTAKRLADDPLQHSISSLSDTAQMPVPKPLDMGNPVAFRAGLQERAQWAAVGTRTFETQPMPALTTQEATQVRAAIDAADPKGKAQIYGDIVSSLPGPVRAATLEKIAKGGGGSMIEAFAGSMIAVEPAVGESIIRGQAAMKTRDTYDLNKSTNKDAANASLDKALPAAVFSVAARTDPNGAYATMRGAITARAADIAASDPNFKGDFTDAIIKRATDDVTGGIVTHNGTPVIAPIRGMTQRQFDARVWGLTGLDLAGVTTQSGQPITPEYIRGNAQLESVADGRYLVRLGKDYDRPIYAFRDVGAAVEGRMRPFVLDLRNVTPAADMRSQGVEFKPFPRG